MAMTSELYRGMIIKYNNEPHILIEKEFHSPGKGGAFNRCKLKAIKTGKIFQVTFRSNEKLDELDIETRNMQYLYLDGNNAVFMNPETYDQFNVSLDSIPGGTEFLHTESKYIMSFYEDEVIYVQLPPKITLEVTETSDAVRGDTATNAYKQAVVETGAAVQVPLFVKQGDRIVINTEDKTYFSKAN